VDSSWLDLRYLPEIFGLALVIGCFRPLVRRAGRHVNLWFAGWFCLLLHFVALSFPLHPDHANSWLRLIERSAFALAILLFAYTAENDPAQRVAWPLPPILAAPLSCQAAVDAFPAHSVALDRLAVLLFLAPALYLLFAAAQPNGKSHLRRTRQAIVFGIAYLTLAGLALVFDPLRPSVVGNAELTLLLLGAAFLFGRSAPRTHRGVVAAVTGMAAWALTWPALSLYAKLVRPIHLPQTIRELPLYLMVGGIILTLLEEHIRCTERLAMHDPLTDLANRRMFEERLALALEEARVDRTTIACLVIDVDNFKTINDTLGHDAGDQILRALSVRLAWHISPRDLLARTGGDEFTALLAGVHNEHHLKFVAGAMMSAASVPILVDNKSVDVRISIGIALSPDHADDTEGLRRAADQAMYSAKRRGGSILAFAGEE
jgi:diguanylate cyclase (GGDEF)-like protein